MNRSFTCRASFVVHGRWISVKWTAHGDGNKHAFILDKAAELGATGWDFGQADYFEADRCQHGSR